MPKIELYGTKSCPYTGEMREWLDWKNLEYEEFDVETDADARERMTEATGGDRTVPVLIEDGKVTRVGWQGRGCIV